MIGTGSSLLRWGHICVVDTAVHMLCEPICGMPRNDSCTTVSTQSSLAESEVAPSSVPTRRRKSSCCSPHSPSAALSSISTMRSIVGESSYSSASNFAMESAL